MQSHHELRAENNEQRRRAKSATTFHAFIPQGVIVAMGVTAILRRYMTATSCINGPGESNKKQTDDNLETK